MLRALLQPVGIIWPNRNAVVAADTDPNTKAHIATDHQADIHANFKSQPSAVAVAVDPGTDSNPNLDSIVKPAVAVANLCLSLGLADLRPNRGTILSARRRL